MVALFLSFGYCQRELDGFGWTCGQRYSNDNEKVSVKVTFLNDTFWLSQKGIAELFGVEVPAINKHLGNIYESGELLKEATISILEIVQTEGNRTVKRKVECYNLDAIIAVGYRVNSKKATQFS